MMKAVITGASRGLGKAIAEVLAAAGYSLYLCSKNEVALQAAVSELQARFSSVRIKGRAANLSNKAEVQSFAAWIKNETADIRLLVNNAGSFVPGNISTEEDGALEEMIGVNLYSAYHLTRSLLPLVQASGRGHIFNMCSIASLAAYPNGGAYSISKFALLGFNKNLRQELQPLGIKVTAVLPGAAYTDSWAGSGVSRERIMEAADIAKMVLAATELSPQATVEEILLRPQLGDL